MKMFVGRSPEVRRSESPEVEGLECGKVAVLEDLAMVSLICPMQITLHPIATVTNIRITPTDDFWGNVISEITLLPNVPADAFKGIEAFSHLEIIYYFDKVDPAKIVYSGHPRGNPDWPEVGIFCQRKKDRPNQLGLCTVELIGHSDRTIQVKGLDAIDGTPVLDIKPVFKEFEPKGDIKQPEWSTELMRDYWK